jgi:uncharacterized membrane protein YphA (DoxX/SURF4 family)
MKTNIALWIVQVLLAAGFLFAGGTKFAMSVPEMQAQMPVLLPGWFLHFIGVCEVLGGIGMILPGLLRIKPGLTPLAAAGFVIIMTGATVITLMGPMAATATIPFVNGCLAAFVAYGRWKLRPIQAR